MRGSSAANPQTQLAPSPGQRDGTRMKTVMVIRDTLMRWGLFSVAFALLPIGFNALSAVTRGAVISLESLVANGELLLVSVAISAAATGEVFDHDGASLRGTRLFLVGMSIIIICLASLWFADIANAVRANEHVDRYAIAFGSTVVFGCSVTSSGCCMVLSRIVRP